MSLAYDRAPVLENFLRTAASLVAPTPITFLQGMVLKQLQQFLDVPHVGILQRNRTQPISRELRVYVYHTLSDQSSPEGRACAKFLHKVRQGGADVMKNLLEEMGDILDGVQEYMLEHRFEEMRLHVQRLMKQLPSTSSNSDVRTARVTRKSSVSSLTSADVVSNNDKLQLIISDAIRHELEDRICVPLMHDLTQYLRRLVQQKELQFRHRVFQLKGKPQSYFGIAIDKISLSSWRSVVDIIKEMDGAFLPLDKMRKLVAAAHQIHTLYRSERQIFHAEAPQRRHRRNSISTYATPPPVSAPVVLTSSDTLSIPTTPSVEHSALDDSASWRSSHLDSASEAGDDGARPSEEPQDDDVLSGDDFLPIFVYVIVHSDLESPIMTQVLLNRLCDPEKRRSESGYYLATFEAALHHILSHEILEGST